MACENEIFSVYVDGMRVGFKKKSYDRVRLTQMTVGSLQTGEWSFHVGGVNGKGCRGCSWEGITLVLKKVIEGMKIEDIWYDRRRREDQGNASLGGKKICSETMGSFDMNVTRKRSGGS